MFLLILCLDAPFYSIILISGNMDWTLKIESSGVSWSVLCHFTVCRYNVCLSAKQLGLEGFCYSACREGDRWGQWMGEVRTARAARRGGGQRGPAERNYGSVPTTSLFYVGSENSVLLPPSFSLAFVLSPDFFSVLLTISCPQCQSLSLNIHERF